MQKPSVGRIVHFFPATSDALYCIGEPLAAIITRVWSETSVNLAVLDSAAGLHSRTSVLLHHDGNALPSARYAAWPARESTLLPVKMDTGGGAHPLPPVDDEALEQRVREAGADVAPRVTPAQIDALMARVVYTYDERPNGSTITFAHALLDGSFFLASGFSNVISRANYNPELGRQIAGDDAAKAARDRLWELEGYRLRAQLTEQADTAVNAGDFEAVAVVTDNNQPGWNVVAETLPHRTLDVGTQLFARR